MSWSTKDKIKSFTQIVLLNAHFAFHHAFCDVFRLIKIH